MIFVRTKLVELHRTDTLKTEGVQLGIAGDSGEIHQLATSTNLVDWLPLINLTNSYGTAEFVDSAGTNFNLRLDRAMILP